MRELERRARQLLVGVERGRIGIIGHAQRLGLRGPWDPRCKGRNQGGDEKQTHGRPLCRPKGPPPSTPLCLGDGGSIQSRPSLRRRWGLSRRAGFFVTGTDTDVGKTVVSAWLGGAARRQLLEAGTGRQPSRDRLRHRAPADRGRHRSASCPRPMCCPSRSPRMRRRAGRASTIDMQKLVPPAWRPAAGGRRRGRSDGAAHRQGLRHRSAARARICR